MPFPIQPFPIQPPPSHKLAVQLARLHHEKAPQVAKGAVELANHQLLAADSPVMAKLPPPDDHRAYVSFDICNTVGAKGRGIGPVQNGNIIGFFPGILEQSASSMMHQWLNYNHLAKCYSGPPGTEEYIPNDRIIGCIVAVAHPPKPEAGFQKTDETCLNCVAVVFKMAQGVPKLLGEHLTSKKKQSVSMEVTTLVPNLGVWRPSTREMHPLLEPPNHWKKAYTATASGLPNVGKLDGEQLIIIYGVNDPVQFRGVGMTPTPAERSAKITGVQCKLAAAETWKLDVAEGKGTQYIGATAKSMTRAWMGQQFRFKATKRMGVVLACYTEGRPSLPTWKQGILASEEDPVLLFQVGADYVLQKVSDLPKCMVAE